jgi:SAM-dependent methyltransferase
MTDTPEPIDYVERWRQIVAARREQHDAACAGEGRTTGDYWARRAAGYHKFTHEASHNEDPFVALLRSHLQPDDTVLDIGAGPGRHALAIAPLVQRVIALDPSPAMLAFLREDASAQGLANVEIVDGGWPDAAAQTPRADVAYSAHVLYPIEDIVPFLRALDAQADRLCFLHLMAQQPWFDQLELWEALYGEPRRPQPTYIDAVNVLRQLGCLANVEVVWVDIGRTFDDIDDAFERTAETVAVGEDPARRQRLREVLAERLEKRDDGRVGLAFGKYPLATVWWEAGALQ